MVRTLTRRMLLAVLLLSSQMAMAAETDTRQPLIVFAAASLTDVLQQIGPQYTAASGVPVKFSFAASSALARQIESGARADVFFSADQEWMDYLAQRNLIDTQSRGNLLGNRLVLIAPSTSPVTLKLAADAPLIAALGKQGRLATGDPDSVPAGRYAKAALQSLNLWQAVQPRLVGAENVRAALMYVARGETPLGIVYATDAAVEPRVRIVDTFPANSHPPITYPVAATRVAGTDAQSFLAFLRSEDASRAFTMAGFSLIPAMVSGCTGFRFNLDHELKLFATDPRKIEGSSGAEPTKIEADTLYAALLKPQAAVRFAVAPEKITVADGSYAGLFRIDAGRAARMRVTLDEAAWIDVTNAGRPLQSVQHTGGHDCKLLRKSVEFALEPGSKPVIQISGSTAQDIRLAISFPAP